MRAAIVLALLLAAALRAGAPPARAQDQAAQPVQVSNPETIQIGLSTDQVAITADFSGADLTIFGSVENIDPQVARQGRYDVIVVLEGPARPVVVRRKDRLLGMWINMESETFVNVPVSYSVATTRVPQDITDANSYKRLSLGVDNLHIEPMDREGNPLKIEEFREALRDRKEATGQFSLRVGGVQFLSQSLFRATVTLAPSVPVGTHKARAFLFRNGTFIKESSATLVIVKSGFEQRVARWSVDNSFLYGVFAVALAMVTGWLGRIIFRKD